jgi:3-methyladenine DNA glycosylase AlkD
MSAELNEIRAAFAAAANAEKAAGMSKYMRNLFVYFGLSNPERKAIETPILKKWLTDKHLDWQTLVKSLWDSTERELHYTALALAQAKIKEMPIPAGLELCEWLAVRHSWWDSIDVIAPHLVGQLLRVATAEEREAILSRWLISGNIWLQRICLIYQLTYKQATDTDILTRNIFYLCDSKEFFIQKAIGWALRQYARVNPDWVREFVLQNHDNLAALSRREAVKHLM